MCDMDKDEIEVPMGEVEFKRGDIEVWHTSGGLAQYAFKVSDTEIVLFPIN